MTTLKTRDMIESMAEVWAAGHLLLNNGHCVHRGRVVFRIFGLNKKGDSYRIVKVMPELRSLRPEKYPASYPRYSCLISDLGLLNDPYFMQQVKDLALLREDDELIK